MSHGMINNTWTESRIASLRQLWLDPCLSCTKIAEQLGITSRNAVIGKAKRLGLGPKPSNHPQSSSHLPKSPYRRRQPRLFIPQKPRADKPDTTPEPFIPRAVVMPSRCLPVEEWTALTCKYIEGDDGLACGHPTAPGKPYCRAHCEIVYTAPKDRTPKQKEHDESFGRRNRTARTMPANKWLAEEAA